MNKKDDYQRFVEDQFQRVKELEDIVDQFDEQDRKSIMTLAELYGLSMADVVPLHKPGMSGKEMVSAMEKARKK